MTPSEQFEALQATVNLLGQEVGRFAKLLQGIDAQCDAIRFIEEERFERIEKALERIRKAERKRKKGK